jgi:3D (Asp-Asp-Asp) domain-containing protein
MFIYLKIAYNNAVDLCIERMFALNTNVKNVVLSIILIIGLIPMNYTNIYMKNENMNKKVIATENIKNIENNIIPSSAINKLSDFSKSNCKITKENNFIKNQPSRGSNLINEIDITLTFYTSLPEENGGFKEINCTGEKLLPGMVANNVLPLGTKIFTNEFGTLTVADRGGNNFNTMHRLDVYIPRNPGENDYDYIKRVNDMGKMTIKGFIVES